MAPPLSQGVQIRIRPPTVDDRLRLLQPHGLACLGDGPVPGGEVAPLG